MEYSNDKTGGHPGNPPPYTPTPQGPQMQRHVITTAPTVIHTAHIGAAVVPVVVGQQMGPQPAAIICQSCNHQIVTRVETKPTMRTHLFALILCLVGCWPCACVPYCMDSCNNSDHFCPNCNAYIGSYVN